MNRYFKNIFFAFLILFAFSRSYAQVKDKLFHSIGTSYGTNYIQSPINPTTRQTDSIYFSGIPVSYQDTFPFQQFLLGGLTFVYQLRYNLYEKTNDLALSISISPSFCIGKVFANESSSNEDVWGLLNIPILIHGEIGAGSTYMSSSEMGGFFALGIEYNQLPVFNFSEPKKQSGSHSLFITKWIQPSLKFGIRYWNKNDRLRELTLKLGYGANKYNLQYQAKSTKELFNSLLFGYGVGGDDAVFKCRSIRLTYNIILNY